MSCFLRKTVPDLRRKFSGTRAQAHKFYEHRAATMLLIEKETVLNTVCHRPPCPGTGDELINVSCVKDGESPCIFIGEKGAFAEFSDDDTASTASLSDSSLDSSLDDEKRVSFADTLVSHVWERPRTPPEDVSKLFFSSEETSRYVFSCRLLVCSRVLRRNLRDFSTAIFLAFANSRTFASNMPFRRPQLISSWKWLVFVHTC